MLYLCGFVVIIILSACGGDSESASSTIDNSPSPQTPLGVNKYTLDINEDSIVAFDHTIKIDQSVDLFLYYPNDTLSHIQWVQTAGIPVNLLSPQSKSISFTPIQSGVYSFEVSFQINGITPKTLKYDVMVSEEQVLLSARLGHVIQAQSQVSLRTQLLTQDNVKNTIQWEQLAGPSISFINPLNSNETTDGSGELVVYFNTPQVTQDTFVVFNVSVNKDAEEHNEQVAILIEPAAGISSNAYFNKRVTQVKPYNESSMHAPHIVDCVYTNTLSSSCSLNTLPLIGHQTLSPTVDDIMERVVVSHPWMGDRFREFLTRYDPHNDFKHLLRATTAIVIASDIRPSFYWAATGAIYLDPKNLWLTPDERDTISEVPDYRNDFGAELLFAMPWRYIKDNAYAYSTSDISYRRSRDISAILYPLSSLLYHELAHANDFFPSQNWANLNLADRILDAAIETNWSSNQLHNAFPLSSQIMLDLAKVSFTGSQATAQQKSYQPDDIRKIFPQDLANGYYNYSSKREDFAMLFEEFMMQTRFGVFRDIAITNQPRGETITGSDYIVTWGQRGRIAESNIRTRIDFVLEKVMPDFNRSQALNNLIAPQLMKEGESWVENLSITPLATAQSENSILLPEQDNNPINLLPRYYHKALPAH